MNRAARVATSRLAITLSILALGCLASAQVPRPQPNRGSAATASPKLPIEFLKPVTADEKAAVKKDFGPKYGLVQTEHYRVISDTSERYRRIAAGTLEQIQLALQGRLFKKPSNGRVTVYINEEPGDFGALVRKRGHPILAAEADSGGYVSKDGTEIFYARYRNDLHELTGISVLYVSAVFRRVEAEFGSAPPFLRDGLITLFWGSRVVKGEFCFGAPHWPRMDAVKKMVDAGEVPSLERLVAMSQDAYNQNAGALGGLSRLFYTFLCSRSKADFFKFVDALRAKKSFSECLKSIGLSLTAAEAAWKEHVNTRGMAAGIVGLHGKIPHEEFIELGRRYRGLPALDARVAWSLANLGRFDEAIEIATSAARDPTNQQPWEAWQTVAFARLKKDDKEAAMKALLEELAYQPWNEEVVPSEWKRIVELLDSLRHAEFRAFETERVLIEALDKKPE